MPTTEAQAPACPTRPLVLYGMAHCDSVKRARAWLAERGAEPRFHDFKKAGVPPDRLDAWLAAVGWQRLLNRQGTTWRKLDAAAQAAVVDPASARNLMLKQTSVIKRPVIEWPDGSISVGVDVEDFARRLSPP